MKRSYNFIHASEFNKLHDIDHVATPRFVVEDIYKLVNIQKSKMVWFPFNNYDSEFKLKADELKLEYKVRINTII